MEGIQAARLFKCSRPFDANQVPLARIRNYRPFVSVAFDSDRFTITTANSGSQLAQVLELRHQIFMKEWQDLNLPNGIEIDRYDFLGDHLLIIDKGSGEVVGTYRLLCSRFTGEFSCVTKFRSEKFLSQPGVKLELTRACVKPEYRDGRAIDILWKGLGLYIQAIQPDYLFGCASLRHVSPTSISRLLKSLMTVSQWSDEYTIRPQPASCIPGFKISADACLDEYERRTALPPLLRSYLSAGAKVFGWPAFDRTFASTDLFTVLQCSEIKPRVRARFLNG